MIKTQILCGDNMSKKYLTLDSLMLFDAKIKEYTNKNFEEYKAKQLNCPNCAAPITSEKCEYCGTDFRRLIYG